MRDLLRCLDGERKFFGHLRRPLQQHTFFRKTIERVVDLERRKLCGVKRKHTVGLEVGGIERSLPFRERISARACAKLQETICFAAFESDIRDTSGTSTFFDFARDALRASMRS